MPAIDPDAPATLIWRQKGITPSDSEFDGAQDWTLSEAAEQAYNAAKDHNLVPWIKSDGKVLGDREIRHVVSGLRAMGMFRA